MDYKGLKGADGATCRLRFVDTELEKTGEIGIQAGYRVLPS